MNARRKWLRLAAIGLAFAALAALVAIPDDLMRPGRAALAVFGTAVILWAGTKLDATWVALAGAAALVLLNAAGQRDLMGMLGHDIIWLMIGAFVIGAAFESSGLATRVTSGVARRARNTGQLFWWTAFVLIPLTFLIPSTSGRAAAAMPALNALFGPEDVRRRRAYALLIPTVILVATTAAFTGAGSHLLAEDLLAQRLGERFGFARWAMWGLPFAAISTALACWVVLRLFLEADERARPVHRTELASGPWTPAEVRAATIAAATFLAWFTTPWHSVSIAMTAFAATALLTAPVLGVLKFKAAMKAVNWSLVLFVAAALVLGQALINTQAAGWLVDHLFDLTGLGDGVADRAPEVLVVAAISLISLVSHLFMTSHVARTAALAPPFILMAQAAGLNPMAVLFIATAGMNYCLTLPVCSKALLMFQDADGPTFQASDLIRLSAVLAPLNFALIVLTYFAWWKWTGLNLTSS